MSALLPCPFCGGRNPGLWHQDVGVKSFPRVNCGACGSGTGFSPKWSDDDAIAAWNQRATPAEVEKLRADVERLRKALERIANHPEANVVLTDYGPDGKQRVWPTVEQEARAALTHKEPGDEG